MALKINLLPVTSGPATALPPEIGTSMSALGYPQQAPAPNRAWLAIASRVVPPPLNVSDQGDPLPILFL